MLHTLFLLCTVQEVLLPRKMGTALTYPSFITSVSFGTLSKTTRVSQRSIRSFSQSKRRQNTKLRGLPSYMWLRTSRKKSKRYTPSFLPSSVGFSHSRIRIPHEQQSSTSSVFSRYAPLTFTYVAELVGFISAPHRSQILFTIIYSPNRSFPQIRRT